MYKNKIKQKQVDKERQRRYRSKTKGVTSEGVTNKSVTLANGSTIAGISVEDVSDASIEQSAPKVELPANIKADVIRINNWCKAKGIPDDLDQRMSIARSYHKSIG